MTYRVRFEAYALVQLHGLPSEAFDALLDRVVELVEERWYGVFDAAPATIGYTVGPCSA